MRRVRVSSICFVALVCATLSIAVTAHAYQTSELQGVWTSLSLASGPGEPWWERARASLGADGSLTVYANTNLGELDTLYGAVALSPTGILSFLGSPTYQGAVDIGRTVMVATDHWTDGEEAGSTEIKLGLKRVGAARTSDLAGNWEIHSIASGPSSPWWMRGRITIAANGFFSGTLTENTGDSSPATGFFAITADDLLTLSIAPLAGGALDAGRTVFAVTNTWNDAVPGTTELSLGVRLAASYAPSDLAGTWEMHSLATGPGAPRWSRAHITIAANGVWSGTGEASTGESGPVGGTFVLAADGGLTRVGSATARGALDAGRSVMLWTDTWTTGSPGTSELFVGVRTGGSTVDAPAPAEASLALASVWPNPLHGPAHVRFRLAGGDAAGLELLDVSGRVVASRAVGAGAAGTYEVVFDPGTRLAPGLYWMRLREGMRTCAQRVVVL